jgi:hypothetical protein
MVSRITSTGRINTLFDRGNPVARSIGRAAGTPPERNHKMNIPAHRMSRQASAKAHVRPSKDSSAR